MRNQPVKKCITILFFMMIVIAGIKISRPENIKAASAKDRLITVGGKSVTETMKIKDVKKMFGEPKLVTSSYWGGKAYTFYGENYSDYLYLETYSNGKIAGYGSISKGFKTRSLRYGEKCGNRVRYGTVAADDDTDKIYGAIQYTKIHLDAYEIFCKNFIENNRSICRHAVEMWNAISYLYGYHTPTFYDETLFNINAQLVENGSDWYDYCENTGRESFFQLCWGGMPTLFPQYYYPSPLDIAQMPVAMNATRDLQQPLPIFRVINTKKPVR